MESGGVIGLVGAVVLQALMFAFYLGWQAKTVKSSEAASTKANAAVEAETKARQALDEKWHAREERIEEKRTAALASVRTELLQAVAAIKTDVAASIGAALAARNERTESLAKDLAEVKGEMERGFAELKVLLAENARQQAVMATTSATQQQQIRALERETGLSERNSSSDRIPAQRR